MFRREMISLIRKRFSATIATSLAILLLIVDQTRLARVKKSTYPEEILMMNMCY